MLERQKLCDIVHEILSDKLGAKIGIFNQCDENFDALAADEKTSKSIQAINIKCLSQDTTNESVSADGDMTDIIRLRIVIFYASNHENWARTLNEMCEAVQWTLEYGKDARFRKFGRIISRNTQIDDGTGYTSVIREGGAMIEYSIGIKETPDPEWGPQLDKFKKQVNTFNVSDSETITQTTNLSGSEPENNQRGA